MPSSKTTHLSSLTTLNFDAFSTALKLLGTSPIVKTPPSVLPVAKLLLRVNVVYCGIDEFAANMLPRRVIPKDSYGVPERVWKMEES